MNLMTNKLFVAFLNESDGIPGGKIPYGQRCTPNKRPTHANNGISG